MQLYPFAALRPAQDVASRVAAVPWDILSDAEVRAEIAREPLSFAAIDRPECTFAAGTEVSASEIANRGKELLDARIADGTFVSDAAPCFYLYRMEAEGHVQTGIVGCCSTSDYAGRTIRQHELTREPKVADRVAAIAAAKAHTSPVYLFYRDNAAIDAIAETAAQTAPLYDFIDAAGIRHTAWVFDRAEDIEALRNAFEGVEAAYIADGHHRAAAAARVAEQLGGVGESDRFLAILYPASQVRVLPYRLSDATDANAEAPSVEEIMSVCDANEIMPPKSTYFDPKPSSGLFVHRF